MTLFAALSLHTALYQVSVRWVRCLPLTSFRFRVATDTLVSLAGRFPLLGLVRDLHPLGNTHASQTNNTDKLNLSGQTARQPISHEFLTIDKRPDKRAGQIQFVRAYNLT